MILSKKKIVIIAVAVAAVVVIICLVLGHSPPPNKDSIVRAVLGWENEDSVCNLDLSAFMLNGSGVSIR